MLERLRVASLLAWPSLALLALVIIPVLLLVRISLAPADANGLWLAGVTFAAYRAINDPAFAAVLLHSFGLAILVAALSVGIGFPLTYFITRMRRGLQVVWLVLLLVTLTLSDVLIAFSWQVMLSKRIGLSGILVMLGLMERPDSLAPSSAAVAASLVYLGMPFTVLILYPSMSQVEPQLVEAARTLGASPGSAFRTVVIPLTQQSAAIAFLISSVLALGAYVAPAVLGRPENWTVAVLISNTALAGHNVPRAAAMSMYLLLASALLSATLVWIARARGRR